MFVDKGEFADVVVLVASTRKAAEAAERAYVRVNGCVVTDDWPTQDQVHGGWVWSDK